MKRTKVINAMIFLTLSMSLISCSNNDKQSNVMNSKGYLPSKVENIEKGGSVPEGCEARMIAEESTYKIASFWGNWVLKGSSAADVHNTDKSMDYIVPTDKEDVTLSIEYFPQSFSFHPAGMGSGLDLWMQENQARSATIPVFGQRVASNDSSGEYSNDVPIESVFENLGYGVGTVKVQGTEDDADAALTLLAYGERSAAYTVSNNTLAIGLLDATAFSGSVTESPVESKVYEIDYEYSWNGSELILIYDGESAVYVPDNIENDNTVLLSQAGLDENSSPVDGIYGISYDQSSGISQIMKDSHEGYVDIPIEFEDSVVTIDGNSYSYVYSGDSLTLFGDDGSSSVYSNYCFEIQAGNFSATTNFFVNGQEYRDWDTVGSLIENGFQTDLDLNQIINPYAVTDEFTLNIDGSYITVKANNPYEKAAPLLDCYICSILIEDPALVIQKGDSMIGTTQYSEIEQMYEAAYEKKPDSLRYKTNNRGGIIVSVHSPLEHPYGKQVIEWDDYEVIYDFENEILKDVRIEIPALLYNGLQDNVSNEVLENMSTATMIGTMETRDNVLDQLRAAFTEAGVEVSIDENTGEIVMDSSVLFANDSYELSEAGKQYIDSFMGVYASVILDDSLKDVISEVRFEGHTDSNGSYDYNLELSQLRSDAVLAYCMENDQAGMNDGQKVRLADIASSVGYSYSDLVYDSDGNEDQAASRRVAIKFYINTDGV